MSDGNYNDIKRAEATLALAKRRLQQYDLETIMHQSDRAFLVANIDELQARLDKLKAPTK